MPRFIDQHRMSPFTGEQLQELQDSPLDEFGVTHHEIIYSEKDDKAWCIIDAPDRKAVEKHHDKANVKTDWIHEVKSTTRT